LTRGCDDIIAAGRLKKAEQFLSSARDIGALADDEADVRDSVVTLLVHAGIAAADVICCKTLGRYSLGSDGHNEAVELLRRIREPDGVEPARSLGRLLGVKSKAGYLHRLVTANERKQAERGAATLVQAARAI
jgi:hypothetical protein